jgi:hypothetical protein
VRKKRKEQEREAMMLEDELCSLLPPGLQEQHLQVLHGHQALIDNCVVGVSFDIGKQNDEHLDSLLDYKSHP